MTRHPALANFWSPRRVGELAVIAALTFALPFLLLMVA